MQVVRKIRKKTPRPHGLESLPKELLGRGQKGIFGNLTCTSRYRTLPKDKRSRCRNLLDNTKRRLSSPHELNHLLHTVGQSLERENVLPFYSSRI